MITLTINTSFSVRFDLFLQYMFSLWNLFLWTPIWIFLNSFTFRFLFFFNFTFHFLRLTLKVKQNKTTTTKPCWMRNVFQTLCRFFSYLFCSFSSFCKVFLAISLFPKFQPSLPGKCFPNPYYWNSPHTSNSFFSPMLCWTSHFFSEARNFPTFLCLC